MPKKRILNGLPVLLLAAQAAIPALGQQSPSYSLSETVFNAGGIPSAGGVLVSPSYRITFGGVGEALVATGITGPSYVLNLSFVGAYPPPGQVTNFRFGTATAMIWDADSSAGTYNVYRGLLSSLPGLGYGACFAQDLPTPAATDAESPSVGTGWWYLVTVENRLREEGTKGYRSSGAERGNPLPCP